MASVSDNFNRASLGSNWTADSGGWTIISSTYVQSDSGTSAASLMRYTGTAMDSANHYVQALRRDAPSAGHSGVTARQASSTATYYVADYEGEWSGSGGWRLQKIVSGSATTLDSGNPLGWGEQVTLYLEVDGTSISATLDSAQDLSATDSAITSGTYAGLSGGWEDAGEFDDFEAADLAGSTTTLTAEAGSYTLTGSDATLNVATVLSAESGSYSLTGQDATTEFHQILSADVGSYSLTGQDASLGTTISLTAEAGSYTLTGQDVYLFPEDGKTAVPFTVNYSGLNPDSPFSNNINFSGLVAGDICVFDSTTSLLSLLVSMSGDGVFTLTGDLTQTDTFDYYIYDLSDGTRGSSASITAYAHHILTVEVGSYSLTGQDATIEVQTILAAEVGSYILTGQDAQTEYGGIITLTADSGAYTLTGQDATTDHIVDVEAEVGAYVLIGEDAYLSIVDNILIAGPGFHLLIGYDATLSPNVYKGWNRLAKPSESGWAKLN